MSKRYIKEEILNTARRLFNQRGYDAVSMRDIAEALGIAVGNLTYHYRRKEDLMAAVVEEQYGYYTPPAVPQSLPALNATFAVLQNHIQENAFYFWHNAQQLAAAVHQREQEMMARQLNALCGGFENLRAAGLMAPEPFEGQYHLLAQALALVCAYWVPYGRLEAQAPASLPDCLWSVLTPCLTEAGMTVWREKVLKVRVDFDRPPPDVWTPPSGT